MFCPNCGGALRDGAPFCPHCGAAVAAQPQPQQPQWQPAPAQPPRWQQPVPSAPAQAPWQAPYPAQYPPPTAPAATRGAGNLVFWLVVGAILAAELIFLALYLFGGK